MGTKKNEDIKGYSSQGIDAAFKDALEQIGENTPFKIVETRGVQSETEDSQYEVTLTEIEL